MIEQLTDYDAELHEAVFAGLVLVGKVYNDKKGRFKDGETITTSKVVKSQGNIFQTRKSTYLVFWKRDNDRNSGSPRPLRGRQTL